jgi:hypothetical protein
MRSRLLILLLSSLVLSCTRDSSGIAGTDACTTTSFSGNPGRQFTISLNEEIVIEMGTVGPGSFDVPPSIVRYHHSSDTVAVADTIVVH